MRAAVGLTDGLGLDGDRCIRVIPRHIVLLLLRELCMWRLTETFHKVSVVILADVVVFTTLTTASVVVFTIVIKVTIAISTVLVHTS